MAKMAHWQITTSVQFRLLIRNTATKSRIVKETGHIDPNGLRI